MQQQKQQQNIHMFSYGAISLIHALTVYPKKYAHGFCFAVLCCGYTLTDFSHIHQDYFTGTVAI